MAAGKEGDTETMMSEELQRIYDDFSIVSPLYIAENRHTSIKKQVDVHLTNIIKELDLLSNNFQSRTYTAGYDF